MGKGGAERNPKTCRVLLLSLARRIIPVRVMPTKMKQIIWQNRERRNTHTGTYHWCSTFYACSARYELLSRVAFQCPITALLWVRVLWRHHEGFNLTRFEQSSHLAESFVSRRMHLAQAALGRRSHCAIEVTSLTVNVAQKAVARLIVPTTLRASK